MWGKEVIPLTGRSQKAVVRGNYCITVAIPLVSLVRCFYDLLPQQFTVHVQESRGSEMYGVNLNLIFFYTHMYSIGVSVVAVIQNYNWYLFPLLPGGYPSNGAFCHYFPESLHDRSSASYSWAGELCSGNKDY